MKRPFLNKEANGVWYLYYYRDGKRHRKSTKTKNRGKAEEMKRKLLGEVETELIMWGEFAKKFWKLHAEQQSKKSRQGYDYLIRSFPDKQMTDYRTMDISNYLSSRPLWSAIRDRARLRKMFFSAYEWGYLPDFSKVWKGVPNYSTPEADVRPLSLEEAGRLLEATDSPLYKDLFKWAMLSGMRRSELYRLQPAHVSNGFITVLSTKDNPTKSGKTRHIEMHDDLEEIYERRKDKEFLFEIGNIETITKNYNRYAEKAGIRGSKFKSLRSTYGTMLLKATGDIKYVSQQLGHASVTTTEKHYAKYLPKEVTGKVNKITL